MLAVAGRGKYKILMSQGGMALNVFVFWKKLITTFPHLNTASLAVWGDYFAKMPARKPSSRQSGTRKNLLKSTFARMRAVA